MKRLIYILIESRGYGIYYEIYRGSCECCVAFFNGFMKGCNGYIPCNGNGDEFDYYLAEETQEVNFRTAITLN
jgi:hypothetical protein